MNHHPNYELFEKIGQGQSTVVYRGHDLSLNRDVAIKELNDPAALQDPNRKTQFLNEAKFLAQFEHENILRVYSVDRQRNWIIMEMMQATLASQISTSGLKPNLVRSVLRQTLRALDFLHRKQKVHAAVRPSNLLINEEGFVKLSDFEATDANGELRVPTCGKKYLAPELVCTEFGKFGPTLDLYNLGFTALELLFGPQFDALFPGTGEGAINADIAWMRWHSSDDQLPAVKELNSDIPEDVATAIDTMLLKHVDQRPQAASEILQRLEDRPLVLVDVKPVDKSTPARSSFVAAVREVGTRAAKMTTADETNDEPTKKRQTKRLSVTRRKIDLKRMIVLAKRPVVLFPMAIVALALVVAVSFIGLVTFDESQAVAHQPSPSAVPTDKPFEPTPTADKSDEFLFETVTILVSPFDAIVLVNDEEYELLDGVIEIDKEENETLSLEVNHDEYVDFRQDFTWPELIERNFLISVNLEMDHQGPVLPTSLVAIEGTEFDPETDLPLRAVSTVLPSNETLEFVLIPPGVYRVGTNAADRFRWELPGDAFELKQPVYVAVTEVTVEQYRRFYNAQGATQAGESWREPFARTTGELAPNQRQDNLPATNMSSAQATNFCRWLAGRLPTEHEWEAAVRAELNSVLAANNKTPDISWQLFRGSKLRPAAVGESGLTTRLGLMDAIGNAAEWCTQDDPAKGQAIVKGCSFATPVGQHVRPTWRATAEPDGEWDIGIRVVVPVISSDIQGTKE